MNGHTSGIRRRAIAAALACALVAGAAAGCGDDDTTTTAGGATAPSTAAATGTTAPATDTATTPVRLWFADADGRLREEVREVADTGDPLADAMAALAEGPDDATLIPALPEGTRVLGTEVAGDEARVDLSAEFEEGYPQGSAAELATVGPIVRTAATASGAARVRILVEGREPAPLGTQFDWSGGFSPGDLPAP